MQEHRQEHGSSMCPRVQSAAGSPWLGPPFLTWRITQGSEWPLHSGGFMRCCICAQAALAEAFCSGIAWSAWDGQGAAGCRPSLTAHNIFLSV